VSERITTMLLCEATAMAFYCTGLWFKSNENEVMRFVCLLFAIKYVLYAIAIMLRMYLPTPHAGGTDA